MGTNGISKDGPCLAMAYLGIAQTYAKKTLSSSQVKELLSDTSIYDPDGIGAGSASTIIKAGLEKLGIDTEDLMVRRTFGSPDPEAFATIRGTNRNDGYAGSHYQEGDNKGNLVWDPLVGSRDEGRTIVEIRNIYIKKEE